MTTQWMKYHRLNTLGIRNIQYKTKRSCWFVWIHLTYSVPCVQKKSVKPYMWEKKLSFVWN